MLSTANMKISALSASCETASMYRVVNIYELKILKMDNVGVGKHLAA